MKSPTPEEQVESELAAYLDSKRGRFELWCAERDRGNQTGRAD